MTRVTSRPLKTSGSQKTFDKGKGNPGGKGTEEATLNENQNNSESRRHSPPSFLCFFFWLYISSRCSMEKSVTYFREGDWDRLHTEYPQNVQGGLNRTDNLFLPLRDVDFTLMASWASDLRALSIGVGYGSA